MQKLAALESPMRQVQDSADNTFGDVSGAAFTTTTANTALVESLIVNSDEIKRYARILPLLLLYPRWCCECCRLGSKEVQLI